MLKLKLLDKRLVERALSRERTSGGVWAAELPARGSEFGGASRLCFPSASLGAEQRGTAHSLAREKSVEVLAEGSGGAVSLIQEMCSACIWGLIGINLQKAEVVLKMMLGRTEVTLCGACGCFCCAVTFTCVGALSPGMFLTSVCWLDWWCWVFSG